MASLSFQTIYMGGLLSFAYCVLNTSLVLLTTTEIRMEGRYLFINLILKVCKLFSTTNGEDESGVKSGSVPTVSHRVSMNAKQVTQMRSDLSMKPSSRDVIENDIFLGKQRVHFIGHNKPLKVHLLLNSKMVLLL